MGDVADRLDRKSANFPNSLGDWIRHGEKLVAMFVEQQVVVAKMRATHVPVEIFRLQVECEHVRQNGVHGTGNVLGGGTCEIGRCGQWSIASLSKLCRFCGTISTHIIFPLLSLILVFLKTCGPE